MDNNKFIKSVIFSVIIIALTIFLLSKNKDSAQIKLKGSSHVIIKENEQYNEQGYDIINGNDSGYYVNIDGFIDNNKVGYYILTYNLYNKRGELVSYTTREIIVIENDLSNISLYLKGNEKEYYFIDDYVDKGVIAYDGPNDITSQVIIDSDVNSKIAGKYNVKYTIRIGNAIKEITREVNIVDFSIKEDISYEDRIISLTIANDDYEYTLLPDGTRDSSTNIKYLFKEAGYYNFDIYLKSGSHKKYSVLLKNIDKTKFTGTCSLFFENNTTKITVNMQDEKLVEKYSYNGLEFYGNTKLINGYVGNITVKAYDYLNNSIDIKCKNILDYSFKTINNNKSGFIKCGTNISNEDKELEAIVQSYGYKTRDAVVAAGLYLVNYKHDIPYFWGGKYVKKGFNPKWGCREKVYSKVVCYTFNLFLI